MGEESGSDDKGKGTIDAVTGLVKAVPVYEEAFDTQMQYLAQDVKDVCTGLRRFQ